MVQKIIVAKNYEAIIILKDRSHHAKLSQKMSLADTGVTTTD